LLKAKIFNWNPIRGIVPLLAVLVLIFMWLTPLLMPKAEAIGQLTSRSVTISSGVPSATNVTYSFTFTVAATSQVQGLKFIACTNAIGTYPTGTCTAPTGFTGAGNGFSNATFNNQSNWQGATNFAVDGTGANDCVPSASNILCANRTDTTSQTVTSRTISFSTIKNPSATNTAFYIGIYTYTTNNYTTLSRTDFGATASAVVQTLTTAAAVAEVLNFCIGSTLVDDISTQVSTDCTTMTGTSINLGTLDSSTINVSPVPNDGGDNQNGVAMVRSNAGNGTVVAYDAIQQSGTNHQGTLRITGSTCHTPGNNFTDACINAAGTLQTLFIPGTEMFGMTIGGVNSGSTSSYSCAYGPTGGNTCNLEPVANYLGNGTAGNESFGSGNGFAWDETGTAVNIATSASSTVKQVDDEALILKFASTPSITTPFGQYQAQTDFIAVPTY
jgi:hypothetical protein